MADVTVLRGGLQSDEKRERMEAYLDWTLTPKSEREIKSKAKFAAHLGVTEQTLRNYSRDRWFMGEVVRRGKAIAKVERAPEILDNLYRIATGAVGDANASSQVSAARTYLDYVDKTVNDVPVQDLKDMDIDDLIEQLRQLQAAM